MRKASILIYFNCFLAGFSNLTLVFTSRQKIDQSVFQIAFLK